MSDQLWDALRVVVTVAAAVIAWWLVRSIATSPHTISRSFRARKRDRGYQALSSGLIAAGALFVHEGRRIRRN